MKRLHVVLVLVTLAVAGVAGAQYNSKIYTEQGGAKMVVLSGGEIEVRSGGTLDIQSGATLTAGTITRASLAQDSLAAYVIPISRLQSPAGASMTAAETAGTFNVNVASHVIRAQGEVTDNETEDSIVHFQFGLPPEYVAGGAISISLRCEIVKTGSAVDNASTVDVAVYKQADVAVGSDLSTTTAAATFTAVDTFYTKTFVITPTGLVPGDILNVEITSHIVDSEAGAGTLRFNMDPPKVLLDVKG